MRLGRVLLSMACYTAAEVRIPTTLVPPNAKVTVMGNSLLTQAVLLDLKMSPLLKEIRIFDSKANVLRWTDDLNQIQTDSVVVPYYAAYKLGACLKDVDVIVLTGGYYGVPGESQHSVFMKNVAALLDLSYDCAHHNPSAALVVLTPPTTRNVPMMSELYEKIGIKDEGKIMSPMSHHEMLATQLVAETFSLPSTVVSLPVVGGNCPHSVIPVFSRAVPQNEFTELQMEDILKSMRSAHEEIAEKQNGKPVTLSTAMATSKLILDILKGVFGMKHNPTSVFMRSDVLMNVKYLGMPVQFGPGGVKMKSSMPQLSDYEVKLLSEVVIDLQKDAEIGKAAALSKWNDVK